MGGFGFPGFSAKVVAVTRDVTTIDSLVGLAASSTGNHESTCRHLNN